MSTPVTRRLLEIEEALAKALSRGDFEVVTYDGERYLEPILAGHILGFDHIHIVSLPRLRLNSVARDLERYLS